MHGVTRKMAWAHGAPIVLLLSCQCFDGEPPRPGGAGAQGADEKAGPPVLNVPDSGKDLGRVTQGAVVSHRAWYNNAGGQPLVLKRVLPTCGTRLKDLDPQDLTLPAGGRGSFEFELDTTGFTKGRRCLCAQIQ